MAVLVRTNQSITCVHRSDPNVIEGKVTPDPEWLLADGQPAEASRFKVRALNPDEYNTMKAFTDTQDRAKYVCSVALLTLDGEPAGDIGSGWATEVCNLVVAITNGPLAGRIQRYQDAEKAVLNANP